MNNGIMNNEFTITMKFANVYELHEKGLLTKWCMQETVLIRIVQGSGYDIIQERYKICLKYKSWNRQFTILKNERSNFKVKQGRGSSQYEAMQGAFYNTKYSRDNFTIVI